MLLANIRRCHFNMPLARHDVKSSTVLIRYRLHFLEVSCVDNLESYCTENRKVQTHIGLKYIVFHTKFMPTCRLLLIFIVKCDLLLLDDKLLTLLLMPLQVDVIVGC